MSLLRGLFHDIAAIRENAWAAKENQARGEAAYKQAELEALRDIANAIRERKP